MLLWHDSLEYATNYLAAAYPGSTAIPLVGQVHEHSGRTCIEASSGFLKIPVTPTDNTCVVGLLVYVSVPSGTPADNSTILEFKTAGGVLKVVAKMRTTGSGWKLQFQTSSSGKWLLVTPKLKYATWLYLEIKIVFQDSQGSIVFRVNGVETARVENVTTDTNTLVPWGSLFLHFGISPGALRVADLYVMDGAGTDKTFRSFLGKSFSRRQFPLSLRTDKFQWGPSASLGGKYRLIVKLGQSNEQGIGTLPYPTAPWRSPNPHLPIWNRVAQAFQPLEAAINSSGIFTSNPRWGSEMMFAERIARMTEASGDSTPGNYRLIKAAQDGSTVLSGYPDFVTWDPSTVNSLFQQLVVEMNAAIASLGGIGNIERIDYFWYQGESEGIANVGLTPYPGEYFIQTFVILTSLVSLFVTESVVHLVKIHHSIADAYPGGSVVRARQQLIRSLIPTGDFLDIDYLTTLAESMGVSNPPLELLAHLDFRSLDRLGEQQFNTWLRYQGFADFIKDEFFIASPDNKWIGSNSAGTSFSLEQVGSLAYDLVNEPVMASSARIHSDSTSDGKSVRVSINGTPIFSRVLPAESPWASGIFGGSRIVAPENLVGDMKLELL